MTAPDIDPVHDLATRALSPFLGESTPDETLRRVYAARVRFGRQLATDPGGCWVAEEDGTLVGAGVAIVREGLWGLSLLAVDPERHARGVGTALMGAALAYGEREGARDGLIVASPDPRALRLYFRSGFACRPFVDAGGIVERERLPDDDGRVVVSRDVARTEAASRHVRGASHAGDIASYLEGGMELLVDAADRGFAVHHDGSVRVLAALDDATATSLLWGALRRSGPGSTVELPYLTQGQDWAIAVALEAGLALSPTGALFVRGTPGPLRPYVPSGAYL